MSTMPLPGGTVHATTPDDVQRALLASAKALKLWREITPLARNEWICWMSSAKQESTHARRVRVGISKLESGMRRPCCWSGCPHREHDGT